MINIALYQPDIPQNTAAIIRLASCLNLKVHIIEPCGFSLDDPRFKRVAMDYKKLVNITRYEDFKNLKEKNLKSSAGVPERIHDEIDNKLKIPMNKKSRSVNVAITVAIVSSEALKQNNFLK